MRKKAADSLQTPRSLGYRMPAEWEPHTATWLAWPHNRNDWPGKFEPIPWIFADIIRHLAKAEDVHLIVASTAEQRKARDVLRRSHVDTARVRWHVWPTNRIWTRDSGPIFIKNGADISLTNWRFNAWAKYSNWKQDDLLPDRVARHLRLRQFMPVFPAAGKRVRVVLEGGSIDVNGRGLMLTTEECHLSHTQQRNAALGRRDLEAVFREYLGVERVIWLGRGIAGDDTHGHVDDISRFVAPGTVLTAVERKKSDANYEPLRDNLRRLRSATDLTGRKLEIVDVPLPRPIAFRGQRLPASYANFYIANGLVLVPTFNDPNDRVALNILAGLFPKRQIVGIHCGDFIWGLGAIHCMTQQQPA